MALSDVRVRVVDLDTAPGGDSTTLDTAERERAARLRDATDRRRYVTAHVELRRVLGDATGVAAVDVEILRAPCLACGEAHGKPVTRGAHFSLSRSGRWAAIALAEEPCGVDIEQAQDATRLAPLHADVVTPGEPLPPGPLGLLRTWVRKEALLKATGAGLTRPMTEVRADQALARGILRDLDGLPSGLVGAMAVADDSSGFTSS
ncbi:hypothetical protein AX769_19710 [Frondihabitans sp. PAMC 28766]|uniref:4'-phosphopantetheinyl transferase family protein n=1 Tax=Frondihabitans sp. PAMC 28766 TaxID=1795630 RepID=UPI00078DC77E|nr:4'-phosphopantetheinyl transferase superfamily protein [Frondihabitans sp. PAMC 28766]AMM21963.1 hypothetical protein AX769_19710 [Frondihabitans sp. PAMC 28766]